MDAKLQDPKLHIDSYAQTMEFIRKADEIRRIEASLKFMAKPYNIHRKITLQNHAKMDAEHGIANPCANPKIESQNLTLVVDTTSKNSHGADEKKSDFIKPTKKHLDVNINGNNYKFRAEIKTNSLFIEQEKAGTNDDERALSVVNLKKSTTKEIKTLKKKRKKEIKMKRMMSKKQFKAEQRQIKMEIKMRKIIHKRMKMTRRKADKQRKRAEKMLKLQNKLEKIFVSIYSYLKRLFDVVSLVLGLTCIILSIFTAGVPPVPMVLIGSVLTMVGISSLSMKFIRKAQAARRAEKYKNSYLSTVQVKGKTDEVQVVI